GDDSCESVFLCDFHWVIPPSFRSADHTRNENGARHLDTHDKIRGSFPQGQLSQPEFLAKFDAIKAAALRFGAESLYPSRCTVRFRREFQRVAYSRPLFCSLPSWSPRGLRLPHQGLRLIFAGLVDIGDGRKMYFECRGSGSPTVVLIAAKGNSAAECS